jgi:hypothetical protein
MYGWNSMLRLAWKIEKIKREGSEKADGPQYYLVISVGMLMFNELLQLLFFQCIYNNYLFGISILYTSQHVLMKNVKNVYHFRKVTSKCINP